MNAMRHICAVAVLAAILTPGAGVAEQASLRVRIAPSVARAPAVVIVNSIVEPSAANRWLEVEVDSADYYASSTVDLDGVRAARLHAVVFRDIPCGEYEVQVSLLGASGPLQTVYSRLVVMD